VRAILFLTLLLGTSLLLAQEPSGNIVIRPKNGSTPAAPAPTVTPSEEKSNFIVIRPTNGKRPEPQLVTESAKANKPTDGKPTPRAKAEPIPISNPRTVEEPKTEKSDEKAAPNKNSIVLETWDAAYLKGTKVGYFHTVVRERESNGKKYLYATREHRLTLKRFGQVTEQSTEDATLETVEGEVLTTRMELALGPQQKLVLTGKVTDGILSTKSEGVIQKEEKIAWPAGVLGIGREATLFKDKKPKEGDSFEYQIYEGRLNRVMKINVVVKALETIALVQGEKPRPMFRLVSTMDSIKDKDGKVLFKMPASTMWIDGETYEPMRTDQDMPSLGGRLIIVRTTKEAALKAPTNVPDLFDVQSIRLNREVPQIHELKSVVYRIASTEDAELSNGFPEDARQKVKNIDAKTGSFELHVEARREPSAPAGEVKPLGEEYLAAAMANVPNTASLWQKAKAIEAWVHNNMRAVEFSQAMGTAGQVAKTLSGDCTEYAMLAAAMCRANGIPSRTALGLVYAPAQGGKPFLAYHMWYEVNIGGEWLALDATLGKGSVGPGHIKITDHNWHNEQTFAPLLPVLRVLMASPKMELLSTDGK
jgi:Transglutaminase-like superfamily